MFSAYREHNRNILNNNEVMPTEKAIKTPEALYKLFTAYKKNIDDNPITVHDYVGKDAHSVHRDKQRPYTLAGFEVYCLQNATDVHHYFENTESRYEAYGAICRAIKTEIRQHQIEGGMAGIFNPSITQRLQGLTDKQEIKTDQPTEVKVTILKNPKKK